MPALFATTVVCLGAMLLAALVVPRSTAQATTFAEVTIADLARASDLVVVGRITDVDVHPHGPAGQDGIHTRAVVQVAETLRGEHCPTVEVWVHGGRIGDRMRVVEGQAGFRVGEDVALFLFEAGGGHWPTGMGRGKWRVERSRDGRLVVEPPPGVVGSSGALSRDDLEAGLRVASRRSTAP